MALQTEEEWKQFFQSLKITNDTVITNYAKIFMDNEFTDLSLEGLDKQTLTELGITIVGHRSSILRWAEKKREPVPVASSTPVATSTPVAKAAAVRAKLPELTHEMTQPQFRKFQQDWIVYKQITQITLADAAAHLYNACDDAVQTSLINTYSNFLTMDEKTALDTIKSVVTSQINPGVHIKNFGELMQGEKETVQHFMVTLRSAASDCAFECPSCKFNLSSENIKNQLIRGLSNTTLQAEILAKVDQLKTLEDIVKYAEAFETAQRDQLSLGNGNTHPEDVFAFGHRKGGKNNRRSQKSPKLQPQVCKGCGASSHGPNRSTDCPAWGKECFECGKPNHLASVCNSKENSMG